MLTVPEELRVDNIFEKGIDKFSTHYLHNYYYCDNMCPK